MSCKRCRDTGQIYCCDQGWPCPCTKPEKGDEVCLFPGCLLKRLHPGQHAGFHFDGGEVVWLGRS